MKTQRREEKRSSIQTKLKLYIWICVAPFVLLAGLSVFSMYQYYQDYDSLIRNIASANTYNISFKDDMDEMMYKIIIGSANWTDAEEKLEGEDPKGMIRDAKAYFNALKGQTEGQDVQADLDALIRLLDILYDRVDDILDNVEEGGHYDENVEMLDMNIRTLTTLVQEDIQKYIYDEAVNIEKLRQQVSGSLIRLICSLLAILLLLIVFSVFVSERLADRVTKPITDLCGMAEKFSKGDFTVSYHTETNDEMETLAENFNNMVNEIRMLVNNIHKEQENAKNMELRLLQEQINPHFLYNTLDTITWLTESGDKKQAVRMIQELSSFFRTTLSRGREQITVREEQEHIHSYLEIQHFRYQDIMDYDIRFSEEILDCGIRKLTLQPIIENALYHGIKNKRGKGSIIVTGELKGGDLVFTIRDDGIGMTTEELEHLRGLIDGRIEKRTKGGFGMANVQKRIVMQYGRSYGISVESVHGKGTRVTVKIPREPGTDSRHPFEAESPTVIVEKRGR